MKHLRWLVLGVFVLSGCSAPDNAFWRFGWPEGITDQSKGRDYLAVMRSNLTALEAANGCR